MRDVDSSIGKTVVFAAVLGAFLISHADAATLTEYPIPTSISFPTAIAPGSDGALWFTARGAISASIGRVTTAAAFTEYPLPFPPGPPFFPGFITSGSDGALWFTAVNPGIGTSLVDQITTAGVITQKDFLFGDAGPGGITSGPDGAIWLANPIDPRHGSEILRIPVDGSAPNHYGISFEAINGPFAVNIATGPDGALWFSGRFWFSLEHFIGRITTDGAITAYLLPADSSAEGITAGPDGALWFTEGNGVFGFPGSGNKIGRITTSGAITEYPIPTANAGAFFITTGPDGALWFTERYANQIGRISTTGVITEYPIPTANSAPGGITTGGDGALWFTEMNANNIGRLVPDPATIPALISFIQGLAQLNQGEQNSLIVKLNAAGKSAGKPACNHLNAFMNEVNALLQSGRLDASSAKELITGAQAVQTSLDCSS